ncbi:MAG: hypothetical protein KGJ89_04310 [Patescibacteria group bacterium]|nr:hypothetical protein [Patescibacteria group bacterium]MDE2015345.1 hypothetical protein [Patescibacteria group bacterium]MDE2227150.1 hypothetical protein [Patescibacteria group bacterium]
MLLPESKFGKTIQRLEFKLPLFFAYVSVLVYAWIRTGHLLPVLFVHLFFVLIVGIVYFGQEFLMFFFSPIFLVLWPLQNIFVRKYLKKFSQNAPTEAVVVLGHSNWFTLEGWVKPIFLKREIKGLVKLLEAKQQNFSFYPDSNISDVEKIMSNQNIKEVYFFGHGNSHCFQLSTDEILYYCDFNDPKYGKEFVHQVHCGLPHGKSLVDYVVPEKNRPQCFLFRKPINSGFIMKELKRRERAVLG